MSDDKLRYNGTHPNTGGIYIKQMFNDDGEKAGRKRDNDKVLLKKGEEVYFQCYDKEAVIKGDDKLSINPFSFWYK